MQLGDETKHIRNVLDHVTTNDLFKLIVAEWIRKGAEIVNDVCVASRICIDADRAGKFVLTAADIKNFFLLLVSLRSLSSHALVTRRYRARFCKQTC